MADTEFRDVPLDAPIVRGETRFDSLRLRKPAAGELRGLNLAELVQLNVTAVGKLIPRISTPTLSPQEVNEMDPADLLAVSAEIADFLLQKRAKPVSPDA